MTTATAYLADPFAFPVDAHLPIADIALAATQAYTAYAKEPSRENWVACGIILNRVVIAGHSADIRDTLLSWHRSGFALHYTTASNLTSALHSIDAETVLLRGEESKTEVSADQAS